MFVYWLHFQTVVWHLGLSDIKLWIELNVILAHYDLDDVLTSSVNGCRYWCFYYARKYYQIYPDTSVFILSPAHHGIVSKTGVLWTVLWYSYIWLE